MRLRTVSVKRVSLGQTAKRVQSVLLTRTVQVVRQSSHVGRMQGRSGGAMLSLTVFVLRGIMETLVEFALYVKPGRGVLVVARTAVRLTRSHSVVATNWLIASVLLATLLQPMDCLARHVFPVGGSQPKGLVCVPFVESIHIPTCWVRPQLALVQAVLPTPTHLVLEVLHWIAVNVWRDTLRTQTELLVLHVMQGRTRQTRELVIAPLVV